MPDFEENIPTGEELLNQVEQTKVEAPEPTEHEKRAMEKGWVPKDQWSGDPDTWRPAKDYLDRGELIGKIMAQGRQLEELRQAVTFLSEKEKKQFVAGYERAIEETKAQRNAFLREGEVLEAAELDDKLDMLKEQAREAKQAIRSQAAPPGPSQTFISWAERNTWYNGRDHVSKFADDKGDEFKRANPSSTESEMLEYVEREVKKEYAHKFGTKAAPNPDGDGRNPRGTSGKNSMSGIEASLTDLERTIMRTVLKTTPGMTKEQYLKDYSENR